MSPSHSWKAFHMAPTNLSFGTDVWTHFFPLISWSTSVPKEKSLVFVATKLLSGTRPGAFCRATGVISNVFLPCFARRLLSAKFPHLASLPIWPAEWFRACPLKWLKPSSLMRLLSQDLE